jgi:hypothetical protein
MFILSFNKISMSQIPRLKHYLPYHIAKYKNKSTIDWPSSNIPSKALNVCIFSNIAYENDTFITQFSEENEESKLTSEENLFSLYHTVIRIYQYSMLD